MKKIIITTIIVFILSHCEVRIQKTNAQLTSWVTDANGYVETYYSRKTIDSMEYLIVIRGGSKSGINVINLTKEKLEVEKLRLEIDRLKKSNNNR